MSAAEAVRGAAKSEDKAHRQESMQTISIMAPRHYAFDEHNPNRPMPAFEMEVVFPHTGAMAPVRFESMQKHFRQMPRCVNPADFFGNIGRNLFLVEMHAEPPMEVQAWPEVFVPVGIADNLKNTAELMDYNLRSFPRDLGAHNTVMDAIAYSVHKTKESANWLFNPLLTLDEALIRLGFRSAPEPEPKEEGRKEEGFRRDDNPHRHPGHRYSGIAEILARAWQSENRGGSRAGHAMSRQTDQVGYYYSRSQLPACPQVRALLDMPASTIPHYLED